MPTPQAKPECGHGAIFSHPPPPQSTPATLPRGAWASQTSRGGERVTATPLSHPITPAASERPARLAPPLRLLRHRGAHHLFLPLPPPPPLHNPGGTATRFPRGQRAGQPCGPLCWTPTATSALWDGAGRRKRGAFKKKCPFLLLSDTGPPKAIADVSKPPCKAPCISGKTKTAVGRGTRRSPAPLLRSPCPKMRRG